MEVIEFDDGHKPGSTAEDTKLIMHQYKTSSKFIAVFDELLPSEWCDRIYNYSCTKGKPWGLFDRLLFTWIFNLFEIIDLSGVMNVFSFFRCLHPCVRFAG